MKRHLLFALTVVVLLGSGSTLAIMNDACKTSHHPWCAPVSITRHDAKIGPG